MGARRRTDEERAWLYEHVPAAEPRECRQAFLAEFGWCPTETAWCTWNQRHGLRHRAHESTMASRSRVERIVRWSEEPEMSAWMGENDRGRSTKAISDEFRERFGFGLTQNQVSAYRMSHGTQTRKGRGNGRDVPVGTLARSKNGYMKKKVRELPSVPGTKDNWEFVHVLEYRRHHGEVPPGHDVMFANGDIHDYSPDNLVAVPHRLQAQLKQFEYHDRDTLELAVAQCLVQGGIHRLAMRPRPCAYCGRTFEQPDPGRVAPNKYCPECVAAKRHTRGQRRADKGEAACAVCGATFDKKMRNQVRCQACIDKRPKYSAKMQRGSR